MAVLVILVVWQRPFRSIYRNFKVGLYFFSKGKDGRPVLCSAWITLPRTCFDLANFKPSVPTFTILNNPNNSTYKSHPKALLYYHPLPHLSTPFRYPNPPISTHTHPSIIIYLQWPNNSKTRSSACKPKKTSNKTNSPRRNNTTKPSSNPCRLRTKNYASTSKRTVNLSRS